MTIDKNIETLGEVEYGDFQTPNYFTEKICTFLRDNIEKDIDYIFEPTFGLGNFLFSALNSFENIKELFGVELNESYFKNTLLKLEENNLTKERKINLFNEDIFNFDFSKIKKCIKKEEKLLILGNPPWVTNSILSGMSSSNLPIKSNFKKNKGLDAITGKGNFDIAEYIILQLLNQFKEVDFKLAMLCKVTVAKNIVKGLKNYDLPFLNVNIYMFNAFEVFKVSCDACLLVITKSEIQKEVCNVFDIDNPNNQLKSFGWINNNFISNIQDYDLDLDGESEFEWRQGVKHDCSKVMELSYISERNFINGFKDNVCIEDDLVFPFLKSSDIKKDILTQENVRKHAVITQKKVGEDTTYLEEKYPKLWKYLVQNSQFLDGRKSIIYKKAPKFAIFGIGDYSFKPFKVGISGFYKIPIFSLIYNTLDIEKSIMLDDTCYFIGFDTYLDAYITMKLLNTDKVRKFLLSIAFLESKRPYTKEILMRLSLKKITNSISYTDLNSNEVTFEQYENYKENIMPKNYRLF